MMDSKNSKIVGIILIITIAIVFIGLGVLGYTVLRKDSKKGTDNQLSEQKTVNKELGGSSSKSEGGNSQLQTIETNSKTTEKKYLEDYEIIGKIEIPKTGLKSDILAETTKRSLEIAVTKIYSTSDLNQPGNTVIYGHNYRNDLFFSNNKKLAIGDKIYITDQRGNKITYEIYNMYETTPKDAEYMTRAVDEGVREISLQTCTDDSSGRIIIWAREKENG